MKPAKILYVDDEAMALKYFERLISPMAPVITALSAEEGKDILRAQGDQIAVLVSDQRMPGARGNELLRYARDHHPSMVRMLTTAYSELGEAIEAINTGEIYRYITKPWDLESLRADLRNALELAGLRSERDGLLREKMMIQQQQLLASRASQLFVAASGFVRPDCAPALQAFLDAALLAGCTEPAIDWRVVDHADLMQAESRRAALVGQMLASLQQGFGSDRSQAAAAAALAQALPGQVELRDGRAVVVDRAALTWLLDGPAQEDPVPARAAWLAWLLWLGQPVQLEPVAGGWQVGTAAQAALAEDWLADRIERLGQAAHG